MASVPVPGFRCGPVEPRDYRERGLLPSPTALEQPPHPIRSWRYGLQQMRYFSCAKFAILLARFQTLDASSLKPSDDGFAPILERVDAYTKYPAQVFLSYWLVLPSANSMDRGFQGRDPFPRTTFQSPDTIVLSTYCFNAPSSATSVG